MGQILTDRVYWGQNTFAYVNRAHKPEMGGKNISQVFNTCAFTIKTLHSHKKLCIYSQHFAFSCKLLRFPNFACAHENTLNVFAPTSYYPVLRSLSKVLRVSFAKALWENAKLCK